MKHNARKRLLGSACLVLALTTVAAHAEEPKVGYAALPLSNTYAAALAEAVQTFGAQEGFDMSASKNSQSYDPAEQINNMNTMIDSGVQGIIIQISDGKALKEVLDKAKAAGIPVVTVDTPPDEGYGDVAMQVKVSSVMLGEMGCEELGKAMGGKGKVLELQGSFQNLVGLQRSQGFNDCMKAKFPDIQVIGQQAEWSQDKAASITETVMSTDPDVSGVFMAGDSVYVSAVINVFRRLDRLKKVGEEGHIAISGIDGDPVALQAIRDGYVDVIIAQPLTGYGQWSAHYLARALKGETFKPGPTDHGSEIVQVGSNLADILPPTIVTSANVDDPTLWGNAIPK